MNRRGMTLLEVTLALTLFGMLAAFILGIIDSVLGLWQAGERRGRGDLVFATATERFRSDLGALHRGPDGWLVIDDWEVLPEQEGQPAWHLPRLRFLAEGASLTADDPSGRSMVEVAWVFVPEDLTNSRLARLVRYTRIDGGPDEGFEIDRFMVDTLRNSDGLVVLDSVAHASFIALGMDSPTDEDFSLDVPAYVPFGFPTGMRLEVERVPANVRNRPPSLDESLATSPGLAMTVRGTPPLGIPKYALVGSEWIRLGGNFPRFTAAARGERETMPQQHEAGVSVLFPESYQSIHAFPGAGRRIR